MMPVTKGDTIITQGLVEILDGVEDSVHPAVVTRVITVGRSAHSHTYTEVDAIVFLARRPPAVLAGLKLYWSEPIAQDELRRQREASGGDPQKVEMIAWPKN